MHVEQVLGDVPMANRCRCREEQAKDPDPKDPGSAASGPRGWLKGLFGR
jgi:hypothetical protein